MSVFVTLNTDTKPQRTSITILPWNVAPKHPAVWRLQNKVQKNKTWLKSLFIFAFSRVIKHPSATRVNSKLRSALAKFRQQKYFLQSL